MNLSVSPSSRQGSRRPIRSAIAMYLVAAAAVAANPPTLSLDDVRRAASAEAPSVAAQSARIVAAREDVARAAALPDPTLNLGVDNLTVTGADAFRLGADDMTMRRIGLMQEWPSRRKREARRATAEAHVGTAVSEAGAMRLEVERRAGEAWIDTWAAEAEVQFLQELIDDAERALAIAKAQLASGTGTSSDALAAQVAKADLDNTVRRAQAQVRAARAGLTRWIDTNDAVTLASLPDVATLRIAPDQLRATLDRHAHLQVWESRERAADATVDLAQAEKRPDLGFGVSYGARSAGLPDMMMFEVSVGLPLFARNRQDRNLAARVAEREALHFEREDARRVQREALERQLATWEGLRDERARYETTLLPLARDRSAVALASFGSGGEIQPWIQARRDEIETRRREVQLQADLARTWLALDTLLPREATSEIEP
jgi:cobalt-zinc-cadmium efflux system outer membrane protein